MKGEQAAQRLPAEPTPHPAAGHAGAAAHAQPLTHPNLQHPARPCPASALCPPSTRTTTLQPPSGPTPPAPQARTWRLYAQAHLLLLPGDKVAHHKPCPPQLVIGGPIVVVIENDSQLLVLCRQAKK
jgi:hypothetical protein